MTYCESRDVDYFPRICDDDVSCAGDLVTLTGIAMRSRTSSWTVKDDVRSGVGAQREKIGGWCGESSEWVNAGCSNVG